MEPSNNYGTTPAGKQLVTPIYSISHGKAIWKGNVTPGIGDLQSITIVTSCELPTKLG